MKTEALAKNWFGEESNIDQIRKHHRLLPVLSD
jgi:hypothetical protein